LAGVDPVLSL